MGHPGLWMKALCHEELYPEQPFWTSSVDTLLFQAGACDQQVCLS